MFTNKVCTKTWKGCVEKYYAVVKCVEVEKLVCKNALVNIKY